MAKTSRPRFKASLSLCLTFLPVAEEGSVKVDGDDKNRTLAVEGSVEVDGDDKNRSQIPCKNDAFFAGERRYSH